MTAEEQLKELLDHVEWIKSHGQERVAQTRADKTLNAFNQGRVDAAESLLMFWEDVKKRASA